MICFATEEMLPSLIEIWEECFGDEEEYISFFFRNKLIGKKQYENQLVWVEEGKPVAMLTMLEAKITIHKKKIPLWYIYAVSTKKEWRNRGFATKLLNYANQMAEERGGMTALVPASETLFQYYERLGYRPAFPIREWTAIYENKFLETKGKENKAIVLERDISSKELTKLRNHTFLKDGFVEWDEEAISYALEENKLIGGINYKIKYKEEHYYILCFVQDKSLIIRETSVPEEILDNVIGMLNKELSYENVKLYTQVEKYNRGEIEKFGMICENDKEVNIEEGYLGLALN